MVEPVMWVRAAAKMRPGQGQGCSVEPEHLVLGLLHDPDGLAVKVIGAVGADPETVRAAIAAVLEPGLSPVVEPIGFSGPAIKVMELTVRAALRLGHNYVGTEHVLLGLLALDDARATAILGGLGLSEATVEPELRRMMAKLFAARKS